MRNSSLVLAALVSSLPFWPVFAIAKPIPTRPVQLTEQQLEILSSKISLPVHGLKYRAIHARVPTLRADARNIYIDIETEYYERGISYQRYFSVSCSWGTPDTAESLSCTTPSYVIELINDGARHRIFLGVADKGAPIPLNELLEVVAFFRSRPTYGTPPASLHWPLTGLITTANGYKAYIGEGSCNGSVDVIKRSDGSLYIARVYPLTCV